MDAESSKMASHLEETPKEDAVVHIGVDAKAQALIRRAVSLFSSIRVLWAPQFRNSSTTASTISQCVR